MIASSFARTIQCVLCNPLVVIKTRLEVVGFNEYTGMTHAFKHIWKNEGPRGFMSQLQLYFTLFIKASGTFSHFCSLIQTIIILKNSIKWQ
jgi:hypothetical protein